MSFICDWCGKPIKQYEELSSAVDNSRGCDDGNELRTSGCIEPYQAGASIRILTETPEHYHEPCMAAKAVKLIQADIPKLPKRAKPA